MRLCKGYLLQRDTVFDFSLLNHRVVMRSAHLLLGRYENRNSEVVSLRVKSDAASYNCAV
jgi:hypothetical protein